MNNTCPLCGKEDLQILYDVASIPVFQNKTYETVEEAVNCVKGDIALCQCSCGFIFNAHFDNSLMNYDGSYQNEQAYSPTFQSHLQWVCDYLIEKTTSESLVYEIGCGKAHFLELLRSANRNVIGYDPAYEGEAPYIVKEYFSKNTIKQQADLIVLRHVLEHIENPYDFLKSIATANNHHGQIYIEVPCVDWIIQQNAFWDICYEHVNYFSEQTLRNIFPHAEVGHCFYGQYLYLLADLSDLNKVFTSPLRKKNICACSWVRELTSTCNDSYYIWGAGAKGNIFCNIYDKDRKCIQYVVDKNPNKQNKYIGGTGHKIISPEECLKEINDKSVIIVMNQNYYSEIYEYTKEKQPHLIKVEKLWTTDKNF